MATFVKHVDEPAMAECEVEGLKLLSSGYGVHHMIRLPKVHSASAREIVMERVPSAPATKEYSQRLGKELARLHRNMISPNKKFGFDRDNFCGLNPQKNGWCDSWGVFFVTNRLKFQVSLMTDTKVRHHWEEEMQKYGPQIAEFLNKHNPQPSLLHGDLWGGNAMSGEGNQPWLIDPAVYYGDREADLAFTRFFGGFDSEFYKAYQAEWPLPPHSEVRSKIYNLYHALNHYNLFGIGYLSQSESLWRSATQTISGL